MWTVSALSVAVLALELYLPAGLSWRGALPSARGPVSNVSDDELRATSCSVAHTWIADHPAQRLAWNWEEGVLVFGLLGSAPLCRDPAVSNYVRDYLKAHPAHELRVRWSDDALPALSAAELALRGEDTFRPHVERVVEYLMHAPRTRTGLLIHLGRVPLPGIRDWLPDAWVDSLFHSAPTLLRYSELTRDVRYRDEAARQLRLFASALVDPRSGLVTHAVKDRAHLDRVPAFSARAFWARGNGWMLASLVDALVRLPASHPDREQLLLTYQRLAAALQRAQSRSGLFHTVLLRSDTYLETAGSALIIGALAAGVRAGMLPVSSRSAVERGALGLVSVVRRAGSRSIVTGTSLGTNPIEALYAWTPTADQVPYGVGAFLYATQQIAGMRANASLAR